MSVTILFSAVCYLLLIPVSLALLEIGRARLTMPLAARSTQGHQKNFVVSGRRLIQHARE